MDARSIDPRDQTSEIDEPAYRVFFWTGSPASSGSEVYECTGADVIEVIAWADGQAAGRAYSLWARIADRSSDPPGVCLVRLAGWDLPYVSGPRPLQAVTVPPDTHTGIS